MASEDDNYGSLSLKGTPVADLKVNDIKKELDKRGLSKAGSKTQLLERLKAQLLLEKLQQDAAQSSGDELEGKVPNMALQQEQAGQSEFVRQYLEQQQRNLERQMEVKKQVEEERKRKSADESSADETTTHQEKKQPVNPEVTSPKKFKDDNSNAPATDESKMPRPARKSSRNVSKGENGQDSGLIKEKSRSPSPEKESLRERTRSGSSSSSRSATPEASSRRGRPARGRGARRGGRRGRGRQVSRKESRSSSHSSTEEEVMPKKRSRRSTNSISSRSRSRSPSQKASPEVAPATRRSSRRTSSNAAKPAADQDLPVEEGQHPEKSPAVDADGASEVVPDKTKVLTDTTSDVAISKSPAKEVRCVEVLEPAESTIKTIEMGDISAVKDKDSTVSDEKTDNGKHSMQEETSSMQTTSQSAPCNEEVGDGDIGTGNKGLKRPGGASRWRASRNKKSTEEPCTVAAKEGENDTKVQEAAKMDEDAAKPKNEQCQISLETTKPNVAGEQSLKDKAETPSAVEQSGERLEKSPEKPAEEKSREAVSVKRSRERSESSSSNSSSASPPRKRDTHKSRSGSSGSSTDVSPSAYERVSKPLSKAKSDPEEEKSVNDPEKGDSPKDDKMQSSQAISISGSASSSVQSEDRAKEPDNLKKSEDDAKSEVNSKTDSKIIPGDGGDKQLEEAESRGIGDKIPPKQDQALKDGDEEATTKKDKTAKKRKWGSKSSKTGPVAAKKPTSMEISSDSLKNLIGEVKLSETVFDMETEVVNTLDYDEQEEDRRDVKVKRTVIQKSPPAPDAPVAAEADEEEEDARKVETLGDAGDQEMREQELEPQKTGEDDEQAADERELQTTDPKKKVAKSSPSAGAGAVVKEGAKKKSKEGKKVKKKKGTSGETSEAKENKTAVKDNVTKEPAKIIATTRPSKPLLPVVDEPEKVPGRGELSPARHPPDRVLRIAGLVRPFTLGQLKELLRRTGELDEEHFWINDIKSHCLAAFKTEEDAVKTRAALHGTRWPQSNPKILIVDFATLDDVLHRKSGGDGQPPPLMRKNLQEQRSQRESREEQRKEPVSRDREEKERADPKDARRRPSPAERGERRKEGEKTERERERPAPHIREWDKDKMKQPSRSPSKSKERDRPPRRSRSRDRDQRKRRDPSREKRDDEKKKEKRQKEPKAEEEPPAKLLDDLFRKTKATPCIYWLPLTEEQAQQRAIQRQEREKEKQKRIAAAEEREKEELRKREAARLERQKQREKERERSRERERSGVHDRDRSRDRGRGGRPDRGRPSRSRSRSGSRSRRRR